MTKNNYPPISKRFEAFVARLLYDLNTGSFFDFRNIEWDVTYTKKKRNRKGFAESRSKRCKSRTYTKRQVDVQYDTKYGFLFRKIGKVILECKYSSNPSARIGLNHFMSERRDKDGQRKRISNIINEIDERRLYVNAYHAVLVTNAYFTSKLENEAGRAGIELWDKDELEEKARIAGYKSIIPFRSFDLERRIRTITEEQYNFLKGEVYRM
ncbi:MAG: hypothetical protein ABIG89_03650 [Candidatus Woesearchaeota archaeon]